jgi:imidazolonepropionase-like amidohydrolase
MITAIKNAQIFDGESIIDDKIILIEGERILSVGGVVPTGATVIDAKNAMLMPGLID